MEEKVGRYARDMAERGIKFWQMMSHDQRNLVMSYINTGFVSYFLVTVL